MSNSEWLMKQPSLALFGLASGIMLAAETFLIAVYGASKTGAFSFMDTSLIFKMFCGAVGVVAAPAGIYLALGMFWYWAVFDHSPRFHKALWFLAFLATGFLGLAVYCLLVYRRQSRNQVLAGGAK